MYYAAQRHLPWYGVVEIGLFQERKPLYGVGYIFNEDTILNLFKGYPDIYAVVATICETERESGSSGQIMGRENLERLGFTKVAEGVNQVHENHIVSFWMKKRV